MKENKKGQTNGITLIALVVTIVVLLILAGITITFIARGGLISLAQKAKSDWEKAVQDEQKGLEELLKYFDEDNEKIIIIKCVSEDEDVKLRVGIAIKIYAEQEGKNLLKEINLQESDKVDTKSYKAIVNLKEGTYYIKIERSTK